MSEASRSNGRDERLPNAGRPTGPCEIRRALRDIEGAALATPVGACSGDAPEERPFPPAPAGTAPYFLCNAHLRDVFSALDRVHSRRVAP